MHNNVEQSANSVDEIESKISATSTVKLEQTAHYGLCLVLANQHGRVLISMFGGHVLSYINTTDNKERLWLSERAVFDAKTPIRGGIPICWPWFSAHATHRDYPSHGYARTQMFILVDAHEVFENNKVTSTIVTLRPREVKQFGYSHLDMKLVITLSSNLTVDMITLNKGDKSVELTQALHSYFLVDNISQIQLKGVDTVYSDKLTNTQQNASPSHYNFTQEVDRIHGFEHADYENKQFIELIDNGFSSTDKISPAVNTSSTGKTASLRVIEQKGHDSTVVWNPWIDKSKSMQDMQNDGYKKMLCIEAANTANAEPSLVLKAHQVHTLSQKIY